MNRVKVGFFSLSHPSPTGDDRAVPRMAPDGPHARAVPAARAGPRPAVGVHPGLPGGAGGRRRRLVPGRTRRLLPDGESRLRDDRRVPGPGSASGRTGPFPPRPALPVPGRPAPAGDPRGTDGCSSRPRWCPSDPIRASTCRRGAHRWTGPGCTRPADARRTAARTGVGSGRGRRMDLRHDAVHPTIHVHRRATTG